MIENTRSITLVSYLVLILGCLYVLLPLYFVFVAGSISYDDFLQTGGVLPAIPKSMPAFWQNFNHILTHTSIPQQILNSAIIGLVIGLGGTVLAMLTAYVVVFFGQGLRRIIYGIVIVVLFVPADALVITIYQVASNVFLPINTMANIGDFWQTLFGTPLALEWNILNSYMGMTLPLLIDAGGTLVFIQYFRTIHPSMVKAARMDGAGAFLFFKDMCLPYSIKTAAGLFIILFIGGWNQYFWPLLATTTPELQPAMVGLRALRFARAESVPDVPAIMLATLMVTIIPLIIAALNHRVIARGMKLKD